MTGLSRHRALPFLLLMLLLAPILVAMLLDGGERVLARLTGVADASPTYTVTQVRAGLVQDHAWWVGRTVRVRGRIDGCLPILVIDGPPVCQDWHLFLTDAAAPLTPPLPVAWAGLDPLLGLLRHLPLIGRLVPQPQTPRWDRTAIYRVRLQAAPGGSCAFPDCYEALLLDATPG